MRRARLHQGLDLDSEICLVSSAGLMGGGLLVTTLGSMNAITAYVLFAACIVTTASLAHRVFRRNHR